MSRKRGRDDEATHIKAEQIIDRILLVVTTWKDSCNSLFDIEHKLVKEKDKLVLKLGFFDELSCEQINSLKTIKLDGDFVIKSIVCNLGKNAVELAIARQSINFISPVENHAAHSESIDTLKLRVAHGVLESDSFAVQTALNDILTDFSGRISKIINRPAHYQIQINCVSGVIPDTVIQKASKMNGNVIFEDALLTFNIKKINPDIVD